MGLGLKLVVGKPVANDPVHREQESHLEHLGQAAGGRTDAPLLVEGLSGRVHGLPVALVTALQLLGHFLELGRQYLHPFLRHDRAGGETERKQLDQQRHQDYGDDDVARDGVELRQEDEEPLEERREHPSQQTQRIRPGLGRFQWRRRGRRAVRGRDGRSCRSGSAGPGRNGLSGSRRAGRRIRPAR